MIADLDLAYAGADLAHDARAFMARHRRQLARPHAFDGRQVRVTEAGGGDLDQDLAGAGAVQLHLFDLQGF